VAAGLQVLAQVQVGQQGAPQAAVEVEVLAPAALLIGLVCLSPMAQVALRPVMMDLQQPLSRAL
jgi:hypothetical protein